MNTTDMIEHYINTEYIDVDLVDMFMNIRAQATHPIVLIKCIEEEFLEQADTELGDFINSMCEIMIFESQEDIEFSMYKLVVESELNLEMLLQVGKQIINIQHAIASLQS
jgi:hypothetical protein